MRRRSSEVLPNPSLVNASNTKKIVYATHFTVFLYATCYWIQIGVMPYLTRKLGANTTMFGYLQSVFAFVQLCGGPFFGRFGDLFGGKYALLLAAFSSVSTYGLMSIASSVPLLFLSRLVSVAMHTLQGSQMVITSITTDEERAAGIGRLGISYGIGMVVGPLLGGFLTDKFSEQAAAFAAMIGSAAMVVVVFIFVPKHFKECTEKSRKKSVSNDSVFDMKKYISIFQLPNFTYLFVIKTISSFPIGVFQAMFSVFTMDYFHLSAKENGIVLSYVGITGMIVQGLCTDFLTRRFSESMLIKYSVAVLAASNFLLIFVTNIYAFVIVLVPLITSGSVFTVIITSLVTKSVSSQDTGAALGLSMASNSFIRTVTPMIGGVLYSLFGFPLFGLLGLFVNGLLTFYLFFYGRNSFVNEEKN
ncbi:solute carrier family 22 member 18 isoform X1 [Hydra vulgaris]|uniref:solute carrier family 22 member 18 isoform X1 n=1 Tax=Hydra vulgaris TaxID=6087 RepID=UPI001F5F9D0C|nr:solute carrier family 22 member 18 [Hydra vulgaris]